MILGTCDIWSLFHSDTGTPISDSSEFYPSLYSSMTASDGWYW